METEGQPVEVQPETVAPAEVESNEQPVNAEDSGTQEPPKAEGEPEQPKKPRFQERISELVRQREEARRDAQYFRQEAERLRGQGQDKPQPKQPEGKPDPNKYETLEQYLDALSDWKVDQRLKKEREEFTKQSEAQRQYQAVQVFGSREAEASSKYEDYEEVTRNPSLQITEAMGHAIMESEIGPDVWYYLGNNPKEAARIANLSPVSQIREIGKIEDKLSSSPVKPKVPSAPNPISPVNSGKSVSSAKPSDQDDIKTWLKKRNKELGRS